MLLKCSDWGFSGGFFFLEGKTMVTSLVYEVESFTEIIPENDWEKQSPLFLICESFVYPWLALF